VLTTGIPITDNIVVRDETQSLVEPVVAHSTISNTYLVVWDDQDEGDIEGLVVNADGTIGGAFNVFDGTIIGTQPAMAYNPVANQYLVVFAYQAAPTNWDIYGCLVWANGTLAGTAFAISTNVADQSLPWVAYNGTDEEYLVVWSDKRSDVADVYGRRVRADGMPLDTDFPIATSPDAQDVPSVDWNSDDNEYLIVWHDYRDSGTTGADIYGQRVGADGSLLGSEIVLCTASDHQQYPQVNYISTLLRYSVIWADDRNTATTGWDIYGQSVNADGSLYGPNVTHFVFSGDQRRPGGDFSPEANRGLIVWQDGRNGATYKIYGRIREPRFPVYLPLVLKNYP
jgi:hypothetical protein